MAERCARNADCGSRASGPRILVGKSRMEERKKTEVVLADTKKGMARAVAECFEHFGGAASLLKASRDVYLKVNAIDVRKHCYTDLNVIRETIRYFRAHGAKGIYVVENCTQANLTRLVMKVTGIEALCREEGAVLVCLDETGAVPVYLEGLETFIDLSDFIHETLIKNREDNLYVSLPKLKTHSMTQVTLSIKNQYGLVHHFSRIQDHNFRLHRKLADLYQVIRPDFSLIDGVIATNHGHSNAEGNLHRAVVPMNLLIAGPDPLATDVVGARLMGFPVEAVEHLRLCEALGPGTGDWNEIEVVNRGLFEERKQTLTCELFDDFPPELTVLKGRERCCREGCWRNTDAVVELLYRDCGGKGDFTILMGKGIDPAEVGKLTGRVHIAGSCAIQEYGMELQKRLGRSNVTLSPGCNDLAMTVYGLAKQMGVPLLRLVPVNPLISFATLLRGRWKGTKANIPPLW